MVVPLKAGWQIVPMGEICTLFNGRAYNKNELLADGPTPVLRVGNFFTNRNWYYSDLELDESKYCDTGDLLYAWSASFGPRIWEGGRVIYHYHIWKMVPDAGRLDRDYLFHFLDWDVENIKTAQGAGTTMLHVTKGSMEARLVPLPPLEEQRRIVAVLDEAFAGIATATANAQKNLTNARALFEGYLQTVFEHRGEGWRDTKIGDIAAIKGGKRVPKGYKLSNEATPYPYISVSEFTDDGTIDPSKMRYISDDIHRQIRRYIIRSEDLYVSIAGTIGKTGIIPSELDGANLTENACRLVFKSGVFNRFVYYFTLTTSFKEQAIEQTRTAAQPKLALSRLQEIQIGVPDLDQQRILVLAFDRALAEVRTLERLYTRKLAALAELKQSLLQKAFAGELTQ